MSNVLIRRALKYKEALQTAQRDGDLASAPRLTPATIDTEDCSCWMREGVIIADFKAYGFSDAAAASNIAVTPIMMQVIESIYQFFGVKIRKPGRRKEDIVPMTLSGQCKRGKRKREHYSRHQDVYQKGPKILLGELL